MIITLKILILRAENKKEFDWLKGVLDVQLETNFGIFSHFAKIFVISTVSIECFIIELKEFVIKCIILMLQLLP